MKSYRLIAAAAAAVVALAACQKQTRIEGHLADAPEAEVIVKLLDINRYQTLDTLKTDAAGTFSYRPSIEAGKPEFLYLFYKDTKVASLLLEQGDAVTVYADTLGRYTVEGSEECLKLRQVEKDYTDFLLEMLRLREKYAAVEGTPAAQEVNAEISRAYIAYYRKALAYLSGNRKSMTAVPVLFQEVDTGFPVFSQLTDAIHFRTIADSLKTVWPESRYVKALDKEAERRFQLLELQSRIDAAGETGYVDIELPDVTGKKVTLSEVEAASKVVLLYFWAATDEQKMFNLDVLKPVYEAYHGRGLDIFSVSLDIDKTDWARIVKNQKLPWVNVCDTRGISSPYLGFYRVESLPRIAFIVNGEIDVTPAIDGEAALRNYLESKL